MTALAFIIVYLIHSTAGACKHPGDALCYDASLGSLVSSCCDGSACGPWDGEADWYCQYLEPIPEGYPCDHHFGKCEDSLFCVEGFCSTSATTGSPTIPTSSTTTPGTGSCLKPGSATGGAKCAYVVDEENEYPIGDCCAGFNCEAYDTPASGTPYYKYCLDPVPIEEGGSCKDKIGKCDTGLACVDDVCKPDESLTCLAAGELCMILDGMVAVGTCCTDVTCMPWLYGEPHDFFCGTTDIAEGEPCANHVGRCKDGLTCLANGKCGTDPGPCKDPGETADGTICWTLADGVKATCCQGSSCDFYTPDQPTDGYKTMLCLVDGGIESAGDCGKKEGVCKDGQACNGSGKCP